MSRIEEICANSYRNFHVKGFDYLCLKRTPTHTRKAYFFGENIVGLPELVIPHDHRYSFDTTVVSGRIRNHVWFRAFLPSPKDVLFDEFEYRTPLNGGDGFTWKQERRLRLASSRRYGRRQRYEAYHSTIHTLEILEPDTVIIIDQYEDNIPLDQPTSAFRLVGSREPPNLDGLYDRMTPDYAIELLARLGDKH